MSSYIVNCEPQSMIVKHVPLRNVGTNNESTPIQAPAEVYCRASVIGGSTYPTTSQQSNLIYYWQFDLLTL